MELSIRERRVEGRPIRFQDGSFGPSAFKTGGYVKLFTEPRNRLQNGLPGLSIYKAPACEALMDGLPLGRSFQVLVMRSYSCPSTG